MPTREEIKPQVIAVLKAVSQQDPIKDADQLEEDLNMGSTVRAAMALPYSKISLKYPGGLAVRQSEARDLKTVGQSIDLLTKKANGKR